MYILICIYVGGSLRAGEPVSVAGSISVARGSHTLETGSCMLRCKACRIALRGRDHAAGKYYEKWARLLVRLDPGLARRRHCLGHLLLLK
jgi:hypothetical protein